MLDLEQLRGVVWHDVKQSFGEVVAGQHYTLQGRDRQSNTEEANLWVCAEFTDLEYNPANYNQGTETSKLNLN